MRLIDADKLKTDMHEKAFDGDGGYKIFGVSKKQIEDAPTVDAEPVIHAHWIENISEGIIKCSNCAEEWSIINNCCETFFYCPHCGAKMDFPDERQS